ncbi:MAG: peptide-methionine (S)-S-oxide reductase [Selenomonadaceae bacterium]|nr:peptide-methionine (S)-S-oxide reductase [Selenomonadaceae bacterium]
MYLKHICFSGGDPRELQEVFDHVPGVVETAVGRAKTSDGDEVFAVRLGYNPKKMDLSMLMDILFAIVSPHSPDGQGRARGAAYRAGVWYEEAEDEPHLEYYMHFLQNRGKPLAATGARLTLNDPVERTKAIRPVVAKALPLAGFTPAPDDAQHYYAKHPGADSTIDFAAVKALTFI